MAANIRFEDLDRALYDLDRYIKEDIQAIFVEEASQAREIAEAITVEREAVGAGVPVHYVDSFELTKTTRGVQLTNQSPYAEAVEFGARPHYPPREPIALWARAKFGVDEKASQAIAAAVVKSIGEEGLPPKDILGETKRIIEDNIKSRLAQYALQHKLGTSRAHRLMISRYGKVRSG